MTRGVRGCKYSALGIITMVSVFGKPGAVQIVIWRPG